MKINFLGTGTSQGVPVICCDCAVCTSQNSKDQRLRTSIHIEIENKLSIVIDSGPDFRQQMLRAEIKKLDGLVFTHEHKDHTAGMDDIRAYNFYQKKDMPIYATESVLEQLKREFEYVFREKKYPGVPRVITHTIKNEAFRINDVVITPIEVLHYKLPVFGYRINDFAYITDANYISEEEKRKLQNLDVLVINALRKEKHISHFNLEEALELIQELNPTKAYLTHISHYLGLHDVVQKELPSNVHIAYDGLEITIA